MKLTLKLKWRVAADKIRKISSWQHYPCYFLESSLVIQNLYPHKVVFAVLFLSLKIFYLDPAYHSLNSSLVAACCFCLSYDITLDQYLSARSLVVTRGPSVTLFSIWSNTRKGMKPWPRGETTTPDSSQSSQELITSIAASWGKYAKRISKRDET